ncbi:MAG: L,D-transpeptidase/peptidoglycan binding protein [Actinomycetota bacterium]
MGRDEAANGYVSGDGGEDERRARRLRLIAIGAGVALVLFLIAAVGVYAYDDAHKDEIADGVTVGSVDVGGMERDQAERVLQRKLVAPLRQPVHVRFNKEIFKLTASKLRVRANLDGMVDAAIAASQEGGLPGRTIRYLTGGVVEERIEPEVSYSGRAVDSFVDHIADKVNQDAQDASVSATGSSLDVVPAENGRALRGAILRRRIASMLEAGSGSRVVTAAVVRQKPKVTTAEVASAYPVYLTVDRATYAARLWKNLKLVKTYTIAVGQPAYPTPGGLYSIESKQVDPVWSVPNSPWAGELAGTTVAGGSAENPLRARWMGVTSGVGFHGTDETYSLGTAASHGCLRMAVPDVIELYDQVPVGTPVYIG